MKLRLLFMKNPTLPTLWLLCAFLSVSSGALLSTLKNTAWTRWHYLYSTHWLNNGFYINTDHFLSYFPDHNGIIWQEDIYVTANLCMGLVCNNMRLLMISEQLQYILSIISSAEIRPTVFRPIKGGQPCYHQQRLTRTINGTVLWLVGHGQLTSQHLPRKCGGGDETGREWDRSSRGEI